MGSPKAKIVNSHSSIVNPKAFTLIELLVVIAIIALLMAILVPVLRSARNQARAVVCQTNLKQWGQIMNLYTQDNEGHFPRYSIDVFLVIFRRPFDTKYDREISSYGGISAEGITCCPMATAGPGEFAQKGTWSFGDEPDAPRGEFRYGSTIRAWEITGWGSPFRGSYGFNNNFFLTPWIFGHQMASFNTYQVKGSANIPTFLDATWLNGAPRSTDDPPKLEHDDRVNRMGQFCINRHNGYINGMFLDWSVKKVGLKELWMLKWNPQFDTSNKWTRAGGVMPEDWPVWMQGFKDY